MLQRMWWTKGHIWCYFKTPCKLVSIDKIWGEKQAIASNVWEKIYKKLQLSNASALKAKTKFVEPFKHFIAPVCLFFVLMLIFRKFNSNITVNSI